MCAERLETRLDTRRVNTFLISTWFYSPLASTTPSVQVTSINRKASMQIMLVQQLELGLGRVFQAGVRRIKIRTAFMGKRGNVSEKGRGWVEGKCRW